MICRPKIVQARLGELLNAERQKIRDAGYAKHDYKRIICLVNDYEQLAHKYLASKIIVFRYHFRHLWGEAWFHVYDGRLFARRRNTAMRHVTNALRHLGVEFGWLDRSCYRS